MIDNLETALSEPDNREARTALSWAATQNGMVIAALGGESGLHIFGLPIGAVKGLPHGRALAVVAGAITRAHTRKKPDRAGRLAVLFGIDTADLGAGELEGELNTALEDWLKRIGLPSNLSGHGIGADVIDTLVGSISRPRIRDTFGGDFTEGDIRRIYKESL